MALLLNRRGAHGPYSVSPLLHDGVLTITVPKAERAKPRHIEISE